MKHIAFYISSHGYGHLTRCLAVIGHLSEETEDKITIKCSEQQMEFSRTYFEELGISEARKKDIFFDPMLTDIGTLLVPGTITIDQDASLKQAEEYVAGWEERIRGEEIYYEQQGGYPDLVAVDIVPWVLLFAERFQIKSILMSNFTWLDTCAHFFTEDLMTEYRNAFSKADLALTYELSMPSMFDVFSRTKPVSFAMRKVNEEEVLKIREDLLSGQKEFKNLPVVYVSVGGLIQLKNEINVEGLPYLFVTTGGIPLYGKNVRMVPKGAHTQNYMAAADFCITKAGWSTTAEALLCRKPLAYIDRPDSYEDQYTEKILLNRHQCLVVSQEELSHMDVVMQKFEEFVKQYPDRFAATSYSNDAEYIAECLHHSL